MSEEDDCLSMPSFAAQPVVTDSLSRSRPASTGKKILAAASTLLATQAFQVNLFLKILSIRVKVVGGAMRHDKVIIPSFVLHRRHLGYRGGPNGFPKRCFDVVAALFMLMCFAPLLAMIAALIALRDGGSVIYAHERVGRGGRKFRCLKFRTMVVDADGVLARLLSESPQARLEWEQARKLRDDPRIIGGIGHLLRRSSLDELPQIFNVLTGDMSMVGPRPIVEDELEKYGPWKDHYLAVRPGLTGPWQIGGRSDETYENRVREDVRYIEQWQFATDLRIFTRTALLVVSGRCRGAV